MNKKQAILAAAIQQFAAKGFNAASTASIARLAGVTEGLIFHHFGNKEAIFITILTKVMDDYLLAMEAAGADSRNGLAAIEAMIQAHFHFSCGRDREFRVLLRDFPPKLRTYESPYKALVAGRIRQLLNTLESCIARGQGDGSIRELPAAETALILRAIFNGILHQNIPGDRPLPDLSPIVVDFCRHALATPVALGGSAATQPEAECGS